MNNVVLIGRLVRDPELRFIAGTGKAVCNFTLAVDKNLARDKKKEFEEKGQSTADFIRIIVWGKQAENCANFLAKGRLVAINGSISTSSYKTQSGETRYSTDIIASNVEFLEWGDRGSDQNKYKDDDFTAIDDDEEITF
ncbi:single-strand binding protein [Alkaliphilus metalliredigens QYMF]|uniref:Single-stranded DNA-binding protein n=1 Tax=Alkaliphilus metalliredigens (strain QYMF) TaxID=293826 RepID=A6TRB9_ALKMQ|nr:single-stranded DNA-binding protein [Alkaliphilus metalliredigens]ABR48737.1 single-strand binding protein [Alkaliphilus metalliredigens QYMF]